MLGYDVRVDPEWVQLLADLDKVYPDRQHLVQAVAGCVELWCKVFAELLDGADSADAAQQEWAETLMEKLGPRTGLRLYVIAGGGGDAAESGTSIGMATSWTEEREAFMLYLPQERAVTVAGEFEAAYRGGILNCFKAKPAQNEQSGGDLGLASHRPAAAGSSSGRGVSGDDWADVTMDSATGTANVVEPSLPAFMGMASTSTSTAASAPASYLPSLESLPRPDELFLHPPYHLIVADYGHKKIVVQGSHSPSLHLLGEYMKRWCRLNHQDSRRPPAVEVKYNQSCWGASSMFDMVTLTSEGNSIFEFNPAIVLAFVEGVLGYEKVSTEQGLWTYRRVTPFKR